MAHSSQWKDYEDFRKERPDLFVPTEQYEYVLDESEVQKWEKEVNNFDAPDPTYIIGANYYHSPTDFVLLTDLLKLSDGTLVPHYRKVSRRIEEPNYDKYDWLWVIPKVGDDYVLFQAFKDDESLEMCLRIWSCKAENPKAGEKISCKEAIRNFICEHFDTEVISSNYIGMIDDYKIYVANIIPPEMKFLYESKFYKKNIPAFVYVSREKLREMILDGSILYGEYFTGEHLTVLSMCLLYDEKS